MGAASSPGWRAMRDGPDIGDETPPIDQGMLPRWSRSPADECIRSCNDKLRLPGLRLWNGDRFSRRSGMLLGS